MEGRAQAMGEAERCSGMSKVCRGRMMVESWKIAAELDLSVFWSEVEPNIITKTPEARCCRASRGRSPRFRTNVKHASNTFGIVSREPSRRHCHEQRFKFAQFRVLASESI